jgi:PadR family transcriptional regulator, regulatory protein PadR
MRPHPEEARFHRRVEDLASSGTHRYCPIQPGFSFSTTRDSSPTPGVQRGRSTAHIDNQPTIHYIVIQMIGEFEYLILTAAARLDRDAYGASIRSEVELATGRPCSIGALYTTLDRLETKGLVKTWMGDPTPQRGGRCKRLVQVTAAGAKQAGDFFRVITRISKGVSWTTQASTRS